MFSDATILITGGTGSFGKALARELLENHKLRKIVIYSRDELKQHEMRHEFQSKTLRFLIGDVRDRDRLRVAMRGVDFVVHAAALKQVPTAEYDPIEFIKTNIHGAENVVQTAWSESVNKVIALSTDKAVGPNNLYGATKLVSDKLFVAANNMVGGQNPRFSVVRYGNVFGSRGSVVPYFSNLISEGAKSLPITHVDMTRFLIRLSQGVKFVIESFERMYGGEIFVPKIPSVRIVDLATAMAPNLGQHVIGIRPGEKMHETLCSIDEAPNTLEFDDHFVVNPTTKYFDVDRDLTTNRLGERGVFATPDFEYNSGTNSEFLTVEEIAEQNKTQEV